MQRPIVGFRLDDAGDWTAMLECGHAQHVRHDPPFVNRPWVTTEDGRASRLGVMLDCVRCDRMEWPEGMVPLRRTPEFSAESMPAGLRTRHQTGPGTWGRIVVAEGTLRYRVPDLGIDAELAPGRDGIVVPEVAHDVEPQGAVRFHVELGRPGLHTPDTES
jgi:tellurite resistance-related uncharacterized protein